MSREIKTHAVNGLNEALLICVRDEPGHGGACHQYEILELVNGRGYRTLCDIDFQQGLIQEKGINGISNEALLAVVRDRLECFQTGPFACDDNSMALMHVVAAMKWLHERTTKRIARGVEGSHQV